MMRSSQYSVARWLSSPSPTPTAIADASRHSPSWPAIQNAATARTTATMIVLRWSRSTVSTEAFRA